MLTGCAGSANVDRSLPPPPAYLHPAVVAEPKPGEACLAVAARERAGRLTNARIIGAVRGDWSALSASYAGKSGG